MLMPDDEPKGPIRPFPARVKALFDQTAPLIGKAEDWTIEEQRALAVMYLTNGAIFMSHAVSGAYAIAGTGEPDTQAQKVETISRCIHVIGDAVNVETVNLGELKVPTSQPPPSKPN
jgi:hypothetical protein